MPNCLRQTSTYYYVAKDRHDTTLPYSTQLSLLSVFYRLVNNGDSQELRHTALISRLMMVNIPPCTTIFSSSVL